MPGDDLVALIGRSNRLGADPRSTNYAGGNASAKGTAVDPVTGQDVELLWVKGSGGDLGTLTAAGLAVLRLDRLRAQFIATSGKPDPFGPIIPEYVPLPETARHAGAAELAPVIRSLAGPGRPQVGHYTGSNAVLDFIAAFLR